MIEQASAPAISVTIVSTGRALSNEVRASLEAVREAEEGARLRARRQTRHTRLWFLATVGAVVAAGFAFGPRVVHRKHVPATAAATHSTADRPAAAPAPLAPAATSQVAGMAAEAPLADPPLPSVAPQASRGEAVAGEGCDSALISKTPWLLSPEACVRAFEADSANAALALAIAHASYVRGRAADTATWANRALTLDPKAAEAYVLLARAAKATGNQDDSLEAYRHYLDLAPRGWHQTEARKALRHAGAAHAHGASRNR
jgi:tetratricopeptide (TPR) repeat protein